MSTEHLIHFIEGLKEPRVLVVGDVIILYQYHSGALKSMTTN